MARGSGGCCRGAWRSRWGMSWSVATPTASNGRGVTNGCTCASASAGGRCSCRRMWPPACGLSAAAAMPTWTTRSSERRAPSNGEQAADPGETSDPSRRAFVSARVRARPDRVRCCTMERAIEPSRPPRRSMRAIQVEPVAPLRTPPLGQDRRDGCLAIHVVARVDLRRHDEHATGGGVHADVVQPHHRLEPEHLFRPVDEVLGERWRGLGIVQGVGPRSGAVSCGDGF
jgi:hypothetical protein